MNNTNLKLYHDYRSLAASVQKTVTIQIDPSSFTTLKEAKYRLCFAKKVGSEDKARYNVVWHSYKDYLMNNTFSWIPEYQLFCTNTFQSNIKVVASTNTVDIGLGETSELNKFGLLGPASTGGSEISISMNNEYGPIHPGLNQISTGVDGKRVSTPIYVAPHQAVTGNVKLTPVEKIMVWFEQDIQTSTMFSTARAKSVEIDLTNTNSAKREYKDFKWIVPS